MMRAALWNGLLGAGLIAAEGQVDDHAGVGRAAHHGRTMRDHHVERHGERAVEAVDHHAQRIADQQQVDMRIEPARHLRGVGGEADDRLAALAGADLRRAHSLGCGDGAHDLRTFRKPTSG
jgi:hypothetical protein